MAHARLDPDDRRTQLLSFGRRHFARHAFDAQSISTIATAAGVSKGTIYNYFGGRRGFYLATIEAVIDELLTAIEPPDADLAAVLPLITRSFVEFARENEGIYLALVRGGLGADSDAAALLQRVRDAAAGHVESALGMSFTPRQALAVEGWVAFVEATTASWLVDARVSEEELVDLYTTNLSLLLEKNA